MTQASYDLARLRRKGLITRRPHTNTYDLTADGLRFAVFYTKVHSRVLIPLFAADQPQAPPELRAALHTVDQHIDQDSPQPGCPSPPETRLNCRIPNDKGSLDRVNDLIRRTRANDPAIGYNV